MLELAASWLGLSDSSTDSSTCPTTKKHAGMCLELSSDIFFLHWVLFAAGGGGVTPIRRGPEAGGGRGGGAGVIVS